MSDYFGALWIKGLKPTTIFTNSILFDSCHQIKETQEDFHIPTRRTLKDVMNAFIVFVKSFLPRTIKKPTKVNRAEMCTLYDFTKYFLETITLYVKDNKFLKSQFELIHITDRAQSSLLIFCEFK